jgi:DNA primase
VIWRTLEDVLVEGRGTERAFQCHMHDDQNASASVNVLSGLWVCYACNARGTVAGHVPDPKAVVRSLDGGAPPRLYEEAWLDLFDSHLASSYWSDRVGPATAEHFRCGTHPVTGAPTYPIRDSLGRVLGVVVRNTDESPKYRYPAGVHTSETFYSSRNSLESLRVVVLVEGAPDVMALHQSGLPADWLVLGCFGAGLHAPQVELLRDLHPSLIVAAFDADDAGRGATERAGIQCDGLGDFLSVAWDTVGPEFKDAADVPRKERINVISKAIHHHQQEKNK